MVHAHKWRPPTDPSAPPPPAPLVKHAEGHLVSNLIGETVYNGTGDEAESIGDVNDIVIASDGTVEALVSAAYAPMPADVDIKEPEPATAEDLAKAEIEAVAEDVVPPVSPEAPVQ